MMDCPPRRRENARAVRDMIRGLMESVFPQIGPEIGLSSACGALQHKVRRRRPRHRRDIAESIRERSGIATGTTFSSPAAPPVEGLGPLALPSKLELPQVGAVT